MNSKTAKLLKKFAAFNGRDLTASKKFYNKLTEYEKVQFKTHMEAYITQMETGGLVQPIEKAE